MEENQKTPLSVPVSPEAAPLCLCYAIKPPKHSYTSLIIGVLLFYLLLVGVVPCTTCKENIIND